MAMTGVERDAETKTKAKIGKRREEVETRAMDRKGP